ncbi:MAG: HlyD family efflux transporter periplasmic adaptor subunit, partial [Chloroflexota bacterium]
MRRRKWILWLCLIILAVIAVSAAQTMLKPGGNGIQLAAQSSDQAGEEAPLVASGAIMADELRIASELGGRIVEVATTPGAPVKAGDELVVLDATQLRSRLLELEASVAAAEVQLNLVKAGPREEVLAAARAAVDIAEAQRDQARAAWDSAAALVEDPQQLDAAIVEAQTSVALAEQGIELAEAQLARELLLRDQRKDGSLERRIADLRVRAMEEALAAAESNLDAVQAGLNGLWSIRGRPLALTAQAHLAEGEYWVARAGVSVARARISELLEGPAPEEIALAEAAVALAEAETNVVHSQESKFRLASPIDGIVLAQDAHPGEVVAPAAPILTVANLEEVVLVVYVPVNRIGQ